MSKDTGLSADLDALTDTEFERVSALRATLVIAHAFWATLLLPMRIRSSFTLPTFAATDCAETIWINPLWTRALTLRQLGYVLIHEVGHVALLHGLRRVWRDPHLWNVATDLCDNAMIDEIKDPAGRSLYERPMNVNVPGLGKCSLLTADWAKELAAEQVYEKLKEESPPNAQACGCPGHGDPGAGDPNSGTPGQDSSNPNGSNGSDTPSWSNGHCDPGHTCLQLPKPLTPNQAENLIQRVQSAYEAWIASNQRGTMPSGLTRFIERLRAAKVPWQRVLHQYAGSALSNEDFSLMPPHKRWLAEADIIRPSCRSTKLADLLVLVDTSGSITKPTLTAFAAEIAKLFTLTEETLILTHDVEVHDIIDTNKVPAFLARLNFKGGGGTSHVPAFTWLKEHRYVPDLLVGLTDLESAYPEQKPSYPILWCVPERHGSPPPWGRVVVIPEDH